VALALAAYSAHAADPVRVMVKPPRGGVKHQDLREREVCVSQCLSLYLYDWLAAAPEARLADETQAQAVLGSLLSPAWVRKPEGLQAAVNGMVPVDGVIAWEWKPGVLTLQVHRSGGVTETAIPWAGVSATPKALKAVTDSLAAGLGIDPASSPLARGLPAEPALVEAYYLTQRMRAEWVDNSGVMQLEVLQPYLKRLPKDIWTAAAIVRSGTALSTDRRGVPNPAGSIMMVQQALPCILGTPFEPLALEFCRQNRHKPETIETDLVGMIAKSGRDDVDAALDIGAKPEAALPADAVMETLGGARTAAQQAGAIRCLGVMQSKAALPLLADIAKSKEPLLREAAASALGCYPAPQGDDTLSRLRGDADPRTAFMAAWSLRRHGQAPVDLADRARAGLKAAPGSIEALAALAETGTVADVPMLAATLEAADSRAREQAARGLLRLGAMSVEQRDRALADVDSRVTRAAVTALVDAQVPGVKARLVALANHPDNGLAESARQRLAGVMLADPFARRQFELAVGHPYVRRSEIDEAVQSGTPDDLTLLAGATTNAEPHTRAYALWRLAEKDPARAVAPAIRLLADPHRWVRLHAAAVAARTARPEDAAALKQARGEESDEATRLYLDDALARAEGKPAAAARPAVNRVRNDVAQVFLCGHGNDCTNSPIQGYYDLAYNPDGPARQAHAAGKVFLARANKTAKNPAQVFLNTGWRDGFWLGLDEDFGDLAALDGIVLGEESMYFRPWNEWDNGWGLFCREAGIDPLRVAGDREKLTETEKQAFLNWEQKVAVEGFNAMAGWIKLKYGKLKPGFQVVTFMPDQNGPCAYDRDWKFDVGAGYYYDTNNRHRYTQIRRFKTLWPDRPVIWLCDGNPTSGADAPLNYKYKPLASPLVNPHAPPFADALCAWMAGAQPGYFYSKLAIHKDMKPGPSAAGTWVTLEEMSATGSVLKQALDTMFRGVDEVYRTASEMKQAHADQANRGLEVGAKEVEIPDLTDSKPGQDSFSLRMKTERDAMRLGILLEKEIVWACSRLLSDLPRLSPTNDILLVGDIRAQAGALRLPTSYDFLDGVNKVVGADLARYRLIAVANEDRSRLRDKAIASMTAWLRDVPGLLVVRGWLPTENAAEAATAADLDGKLEMDWPWETDVAVTGNEYRVTGPGAIEIGTRLVYWQGAGFKGGVLFDQSDLAPEALRERINKLVSEKKVGVPLAGPIGMETAAWPAGAAAVSCKKGPVGEYKLSGLDRLSGLLDPVLGAQRTGALTGEGFTGVYVASWNGVSVLGTRPLRSVKAVDGGLELECDGVVQAVSAKGDVAVRCEGAPPPAIEDKVVLAWLLESTAPGQARVEREDKAAFVTFVRSSGRMSVTGKTP
jgi:HEAT repeat protein